MARRQPSWFWIFCLLVSFTTSAPAISEAKEYFLATNGADSNSGTHDRPWKSLQKAIWRMKAGDILTIKGGNYRDASFADLERPSTGKITTIRALKGEKVVFDGRIPGPEAIEGSWSKVEGKWTATARAEWRRFDGLWIQNRFIPRAKELAGLGPNTWHIDRKTRQITLKIEGAANLNEASLTFRLHSMLEIDTPYWFIEGISANYYNYAGFTVSSTHHVTIRNCEAHYNGGSGIEADEVTDLIIEDNHVSYNGAEGGPGWASGIHLWKPMSPKNVVRRNLSHHNWDPSDHHTDGNGIAIDRNGLRGGAEVSNNVVHHNGGRGIDVNEVANVRLIDNLSYENSRDPLIENQGEISVAEPVSASGFVMRGNRMRTVGTNPPLVLFGAIDPKSLRGDQNVFCNMNNPNLAVAFYGKPGVSLIEWQRLSGSESSSTSDCRDAR